MPACARCGSALSHTNMELDALERLVCRDCYLANITEAEVEITLAAVEIDTANEACK